uniref:Uncharacterized protein n=1 Tax=Anguilla anguilla TaxID=7936 RepID=A0A0E9QFK7_ANGAN
MTIASIPFSAKILKIILLISTRDPVSQHPFDLCDVFHPCVW